MDDPEERSSHINKTPTLGGIGVFISFSITLILFAVFKKLEQPDLIKILSLLAGVIILLFLGIKDDLLVLSPRKKLIGQIAAAAIVVIMTDVKIYDFSGILGVGELAAWFSMLFSIFSFVFIINAFNLTDGIDGLAASVAIMSSLVFGFYFMMNGDVFMVLISFSLIGGLLSFLSFNLSNTRKIFMGDSGSMFVGFILAFQGISLLAMNSITTVNFTFNCLPILVLSVLAFPILDTVRVFLIRIRKGRSPFSADRNHIHHRLIDLGFSHTSATIIIVSISSLMISSTLLIDSFYMNANIELLLVLLLAPVLYLFPFVLEQKKGNIRFTFPKLTF
ncbi:MraY family glycosyltransferase [Aquimarina addita]|uniref:MraY family glycosyltransferase n=2 Tax=Aquimarina addita TaxID=870485 RepID=A0ABP6UID8_9FLAO